MERSDLGPHAFRKTNTFCCTWKKNKSIRETLSLNLPSLKGSSIVSCLLINGEVVSFFERNPNCLFPLDWRKKRIGPIFFSAAENAWKYLDWRTTFGYRQFKLDKRFGCFRQNSMVMWAARPWPRIYDQNKQALVFVHILCWSIAY